MTNPRPTVSPEDQPEGPETTPGMKRGGGCGPAKAGSHKTANAGKPRAGSAHDGMSRDVAPVPVYYNEFDPYAAEWLANLMAAGLIPEGVIDTRSIVEVQPDDLDGFTQCHFFAGIGGWPLAFQIAGWPASRPVWSGSCPCQPFSSAGKGRGEADERHLWPELRRLTKVRRPPVVFGEQVASKAGREWLAGVRADLEALGYAVGAADLCAAGAGAPHIRQREYWVADAGCERRDREPVRIQPGRPLEEGIEAPRRCADGWLADADSARSQGRGQRRDSAGQRVAWQGSVALECSDGKIRRIPQSVFQRLADGVPAGVAGLSPRDGYPLAQGVKDRSKTLKGIGNAIVPEIAAEFIIAYREATA